MEPGAPDQPDASGAPPPDASGAPPPDVEGLLADLARWGADNRVTEAVTQRTREAWLRRQAEEEATWSGLLTDLAEVGAAVTVQLAAGRTHQGRLVALGRDFAVINTGLDRTVLVVPDAIVTLRTSPGSRPVAPAGARNGSTAGRCLVDVLSVLCADRSRVALGMAGERVPVVGELRAVGRDIVTIMQEGRPPRLLYVRLASLSDVSLLLSG
ncbi:MAG: hypothetical protein ACRDYD_04500 [Acidimicrobiales bacterium]